MTEQHLATVLSAYSLPEAILKADRYGRGHINDTFLLTCEGTEGRPVRYILQGLSREAFPEPEKVMENYIRVTAHLRKKLLSCGEDPVRGTLSLIPAADGRPFVRDPAGQVWRMMPFIEGTVSDPASSPERMEEAGRMFGRFLKLTEDLPCDSLYETIPHFHDTPARFLRLMRAVRNDLLHRVSSVRPEIEFVLEREADCSVLLKAREAGLLPLRITHNDTKLDNVLFDRISGRGVCLVDLDTVMPGLSVCDFGDSIRSGARHCAEDEADPERAVLDTGLFASYARGFLSGCRGLLTQGEKDHLAWGARLMTLECGIRFLTDYLEGDRYFRIFSPDQNLRRCRVQFRLVRDMEKLFPLLEEIIRSEAV